MKGTEMHWCYLLKDTELVSVAASIQSQMALTPVTALRPNLTLPTFFLFFSFNYLLSFKLCGEHIYKHYVIVPPQQMNRFNYACAFNEKNKFQRDYIVTSNRAKSQPVGLTTNALCLFSLSWLTELFRSNSTISATLTHQVVFASEPSLSFNTQNSKHAG